MNKKNIDSLIPKAMEYIESNFLKNGSVKKVYQGYLASFGPTVISSGLTQTLAFYSADSEKNKVIKMMFDILDMKLDLKNTNYNDYALKNKILEANIACKLAIRTFELKD
jgi:CRISPR-associated protein Cmr5